MIRERETIFNNLFSFIDILLSILAFILAYYIRKYFFSGGLLFSQEYILLITIMIPTWFVILKITNQSKLLRTRLYSILLYDYIKVVSIGLSILFIFIFALKLDDVSRIVVFLFGIIDIVVLYLSKLLIYIFFKHYRRQGFNSRNVLLVVDKESEDIITQIEDSKEWGYNIAIIVSSSQEVVDKYSIKYKNTFLESNIEFHKFIEENTIDEVIYAKNTIDLNKMKMMIYSCEEIGVVFKLKSDFFSMVATKAELDYMGQTPYLKFTNTPTDFIQLKIKAFFDYLVSFIIIVLFSPFYVIIALLIKLSSKGPIIFKQKRVGLRGREFDFYKFRSMVANAEDLKESLQAENEMDGPVFKIKNDPRVTKIGAFLRKTSLDEFPQFFNVLKGDMSIVGPRPPVPKEVKEYERWQLRRLSMKPGITCIWQVSGRNEISFEEWMQLDLQYIDNWTPKLDLILFFKTIKVVLLRKGAS